MKKILFQDTSFRDGFQSVFGARVITDDFIPAVEAARAAGISHFEAGGGARFQSLFLYCGESAFSMMDRFRKAAGPDANLQTLARGINVVALSAQPKDMIDLHAKLFRRHGISHIRNFDALNDVRNLAFSGRCIVEAGLHHQVTVTMMELPTGCSGAHDAEFYLQVLKDILAHEIPFHSVCFKDATGTSNPQKVFETLKGARKLLGDDVPIWHHTHDTAGIGTTQYKASIEAGADGICLARKPLSGGTAQPDLLAMQHVLKGTEFTLDIDVRKVMEANAVAKECLKDYLFPPEALSTSPEVILSAMPGGALTANTMMMRDTGTLHLFPQVIEAMADCVRRGGFGTSVTPVSQFYFQQAYANVTQGPWETITDGYGNMILGYFGRTPVDPDPEIIAIAEAQLGKPRFDGDPLEVIEDGIPKARKILEEEGLPVTDENIFIVGALQTQGSNKGLDFLRGNYTVSVRKTKDDEDKEVASPKQAASEPYTAKRPAAPEQYTVTVNGKEFDVVIAPSGEIETHGTSKTHSTFNGQSPQQASSNGKLEVRAKLPGNVLNVAVTPGDKVRKDDVLVVLEAMKMETKVTAPKDGTVVAVAVEKGGTVKAEQLLATLG